MSSNKGKIGETKVLYRLHNKQGLYYSPRSTGRGWNRVGKFVTKQQLAQVLYPSFGRRNGEYEIEEWVTTRIK